MRFMKFRQSIRLHKIIGGFGLLALSACAQVQTILPSATSSAPTSAQVALLLPKGAGDPGLQNLSRSAEQAARLAVTSSAGQATIDLRVYDTAGNTETATAVAAKAIADGADVIVGPLFAAAAVEVGKIAAPAGVNVLALSNNTTAAGGNVFVLGNTFENTANRLVDYAFQQGKRRPMIVHSQNAAGQAGADAFGQALVRVGAIGAIQGYEFSQQGVVNAASGIARSVQANGSDMILLTANYDGALAPLAQLLPEAGVDPMQSQYIGLSRWDAQPSAFRLPGIAGGWFAL
ncbi:MAG: penicillin-binding protein activator, partial [Pseudomonadota bacterium]